MLDAHRSPLIRDGSVVLRPRYRAGASVSSGGLLLLAVVTFLLIGRAPEIFTFLLPLRPLLLTGLLLVAWAVTIPARPFPPPWSEPEVRVTLCLLGYAIATIPFSIWPGESVEFVSGFSKVVVFVVVLVHCVRSARQITTIVWAVLVAALVLQLAILTGMGAAVSAEGDRAWATSTYDPNDIAFIMACVLPLAFFRASSGKGVTKYTAGVIAFLCVVTAVKTESRGGFIALVVVGAMLLLKSRGRLRWILASLAFATLLGFASTSHWDRIATLWGDASDEVSQYEAAGLSAARWQTWKNTTVLAVSYLPLGSGAGTNVTAEGWSHGGSGKWEAAHNSFLQIAVEMGIPGLTMFVMLLCGAIRSCRQLVRTATGDAESNWIANGLEISLYAYIVGAFALSQAYAPILYLLLGLTACLRRTRRQAKANA